MAIYHLEAKIISRGAGRSAIAAAAYQSGEKLYNAYDGLTHDYRKKGGILHTEILLPPQAPAAWKERQILWEAVETAEKTRDSRLARQLIVALPVELAQEDWLRLLRSFLQKECVDQGMCADLAIHDPDGHNPHAHILLTMRPLNTQGQWQAKTQKEYLCSKAGQEQGFTAQEFLQAKTEGWEKQYKYKNPQGRTAWLTPSQAVQNPEWVRCSKQPKAAKFGRQNPLCARWNSQEQLLQWRCAWAEAVNHALEEKQQTARVTHLSHAAQGIAEQPTIHEGYHARKLEKQGISADRCELNRQIRADNALLHTLKEQLEKWTEWVGQGVEKMAALLEQLRSNLILLQYRVLSNEARADTYKREAAYMRPLLKDVDDTNRQLTEIQLQRQKAQADKKKLSPLQLRKHRHLSEQIAALTEELEELQSRRHMLMEKLYCKKDSDVTQREKELAQLTLMIEQLDTQRNSLQEQLKKDLHHFTGLINSIPEPDREAVMDERVRLRKQITRELYHSLQAKEPEFNFSRAANAERKIDDFTGETGQMQKILLRKRKKQTSRQGRNSEERAL